MLIELMSPCGNIDSFLEAVENGTDSVYLGLKKFNARKPAENFSIYNLKKVVNYTHHKNIKVYLTLNIDLKSNELKEIRFEKLKNKNSSMRFLIEQFLFNLEDLVEDINKKNKEYWTIWNTENKKYSKYSTF